MIFSVCSSKGRMIFRGWEGDKAKVSIYELKRDFLCVLEVEHKLFMKAQAMKYMQNIKGTT
jgi:hypothetical protein